MKRKLVVFLTLVLCAGLLYARGNTDRGPAGTTFTVALSEDIRA
jgi:predicted small secreted protein